MSDAKNPWSFLGYDLRQAVSPAFWKLAWKELFYEKNRFFYPYLCEVVRLVSVDGTEKYIKQDESVAVTNAKSTALLLPAGQCLIKQLTIPAAVESELDDYLALEVSSNSPFPAEETRYGWRVIERADKQVRIDLAITSDSIVSHAFYQSTLVGTPAEYEIWCALDNGYLEISGYAENRRLKRQQNKILWLGGKGVLVCILLVLLSLLPAAFKLLEMQAVRTQFLSIDAQATESVRLREQLVARNSMISSVKEFPATTFEPLEQLERLTKNMPDDAYLMSAEMTPTVIRITGQADRAAELMQSLNSDPAYERVTAPSAISTNRRTGKEQFTLEITLGQGDGV